MKRAGSELGLAWLMTGFCSIFFEVKIKNSNFVGHQ